MFWKKFFNFNQQEEQMAAAKERPEGLLERLVYSQEMCETYLGILAKGGTTNTKPAAAAGAGAPAKPAATKPAAAPLDVPGLTDDDMVNLIKQAALATTRERAVAVLQKFDAKNASAVAPDKRLAFVAECKAMILEGEVTI